MFKLTTADLKTRDELLKAVREKQETLNGEIDNFNQAVAEAREVLMTKVDDFGGALSDLRDFITQKHDEFESEYDDKSEKWQEGDRGMATRSWIDSFESLELDDVELEDLPAEGEDVPHVEMDGLDEVENLETEPTY